MNAPHLPLLPGFADPVDDGQRVFRALLDALARPGTVRHLPGLQASLPHVPAPLYAAAGATLLTLTDFETPLWLQTPGAELADWLRFHCGAPLVADPNEARFALIDQPATMPPLAAFAQGEPEYPDRSATLILQVAGFAPTGLRLRGPGIEAECRIGIAGLPAGFWRQWRDGQAHAPLGVDLLFVAGQAVLGLPRSTQVDQEEEG